MMNLLQLRLAAKVSSSLLPAGPSKIWLRLNSKFVILNAFPLKRCNHLQNNFINVVSKELKVGFRSFTNLSCYSKSILQSNARSYICSSPIFRLLSSSAPSNTISGMSLVNYLLATLVFMIGMAYAAVPLYRIFCAKTGIGGDPRLAGENMSGKIEDMKPVKERKITVTFNADHHAEMEWNFKPSQKKVTVVPGETALAFYTAKNPTDQPIIGIATYNILPFQAGLYFNKIQCFCFEEQWLNPNEEVDMPVFFFIDPEYDDDPVLADTDDIVLSYTFFRSSEGMTLPLPGFMADGATTNIPATS